MKYPVSFDIELLENTSKGKYIALEGIDGSGKSTQLHLIADALRKDSFPVTLTSEPQIDSVIGKIIREVLFKRITMPPTAFQYLYSADRVMNQEEVVKPALEKGNMVLSHRSLWSVIPYGVMDKGLTNYEEDAAQVLLVAQGLLSHYHQFLTPDATFYLRVPVDIAMKRLSQMNKTKDLYEKKEKLSQIAKGYEWEIDKFPQKFVVIDGTKSESEITSDIVTYIKSHLLK